MSRRPNDQVDTFKINIQVDACLLNFHSDCAGGGMEEKSELAAEGKEGSAEQEQVDKSEISSSLYKGSSEVGTTFVDSAYGSLGHSASSSLGPIVPRTSVFNHLYPQVKSHTICK